MSYFTYLYMGYIRVISPTDPITFDPNFLEHATLGGCFFRGFWRNGTVLGKSLRFLKVFTSAETGQIEERQSLIGMPNPSHLSTNHLHCQFHGTSQWGSSILYCSVPHCTTLYFTVICYVHYDYTIFVVKMNP